MMLYQQKQQQNSSNQQKLQTKSLQRERRSSKNDQQNALNNSSGTREAINRRSYKPLTSLAQPPVTSPGAHAHETATADVSTGNKLGGGRYKKHSMPNTGAACKGYVNHGANPSCITSTIEIPTNKSNSLPANASLLHLQYDAQTIEPDPDCETLLIDPDPDPNPNPKKPNTKSPSKIPSLKSDAKHTKTAEHRTSKMIDLKLTKTNNSDKVADTIKYTKSDFKTSKINDLKLSKINNSDKVTTITKKSCDKSLAQCKAQETKLSKNDVKYSKTQESKISSGKIDLKLLSDFKSITSMAMKGGETKHTKLDNGKCGGNSAINNKNDARKSVKNGHTKMDSEVCDQDVRPDTNTSTTLTTASADVTTAGDVIGLADSAQPLPVCALSIPAQTLAAQITLLDLPAFAAIHADELTSCAWNARNKSTAAPNVVAFTRRFNNVSFWTVSEILSGETPKARAEIIAHYIRVARHLHSLNNLHALFAVVSGLQSASVYRLDRSWATLGKRDRQAFERLAAIFSEKDNWRALREHQDSLRLPCIPYLGLFLTDFVYIDMAHPARVSTSTFSSSSALQRSRRMDNILRVIALYQQSRYDDLIPDTAVQQYLAGVRYIEELQRFLEDDQYKLSLKLEPPPQTQTSANSTLPTSTNVGQLGSGESILDASIVLQQTLDQRAPTCTQLQQDQQLNRNVASLNLSPAKHSANVGQGSANAGSLRVAAVAKFIPGHRKCRSLGTNIFYKSHQQHQQQLQQSVISYDGQSCNTPSVIDSYNARHLLDDSVLEDVDDRQSRMSDSLGRRVGGKNWSLDRSSNSSIINDWRYASSARHNSSGSCGTTTGTDTSVTSYEGFVRRKTAAREGRRPTVTSWQRYWLQLWAGALVYFAPKGFKGHERSDFKREPCKLRPLAGWRITSPVLQHNDVTATPSTPTATSPSTTSTATNHSTAPGDVICGTTNHSGITCGSTNPNAAPDDVTCGSTNQTLTFHLTNDSEGKVYKFKCQTSLEVREWCERIRHLTEGAKETANDRGDFGGCHGNADDCCDVRDCDDKKDNVLPANLMSFE